MIAGLGVLSLVIVTLLAVAAVFSAAGACISSSARATRPRPGSMS